jgi:hypothetical protein
MNVQRLADGLWSWTSDVEGRGELASLYVESPAAISLLDPIVPPEDTVRFLRALDLDVARHGGPVDVFFSSSDESALAGDIVERYGAAIRDETTADVKIDGEGFWLPAHRVRFAQRSMSRL